MEERQSHLAESKPSDFKKLKNQKGAFNSNLSYKATSPEDQKIMMLRLELLKLKDGYYKKEKRN